MKITKVIAYQVDLPIKEGRYSWSNGNFVDVFDATVVAIETDAGITGHGEVCPLGAAYLPAYAAGVRAGLAQLAPSLIGQRVGAVWNSSFMASLNRQRTTPSGSGELGF